MVVVVVVIISCEIENNYSVIYQKTLKLTIMVFEFSLFVGGGVRLSTPALPNKPHSILPSVKGPRLDRRAPVGGGTPPCCNSQPEGDGVHCLAEGKWKATGSCAAGTYLPSREAALHAFDKSKDTLRSGGNSFHPWDSRRPPSAETPHPKGRILWGGILKYADSLRCVSTTPTTPTAITLLN